jgi:hypothetical protein
MGWMDEAMHELGAATSSSMFTSILPVAGALQQALKKAILASFL